jgi:hypothetical protein
MPRKPHRPSLRPRLPQARVLLVPLIVVASTIVVGCSKNATTSTPAAAPTASTRSVTPSAPSAGAPAFPSGAAASAVGVPTAVVPTAEPDGAPPGTETCTELGAAITEASLMQPGVVDRIAAAAATADAPVADSARRLATAYAAALTARGTPQEPDATAAVSAAAADMSGICNESGLETAG